VDASLRATTSADAWRRRTSPPPPARGVVIQHLHVHIQRCAKTLLKGVSNQVGDVLGVPVPADC